MVIPNIFRFNYAPSLNVCGVGELSNLTALSFEPKCIRIWWVSRPNILKFSYMLSQKTYGSGEVPNSTFSHVLSPNTYGSGEFPNSIVLGSVTCRVSTYEVDKVSYPTFLGISYVLNPNRRGFSKLSDLTFLGSSICWAQMWYPTLKASVQSQGLISSAGCYNVVRVLGRQAQK